MVDTLRIRVYWKKMNKQIRQYVAGCPVCQLKTLKQHSYSYLHDKPPLRNFQRIAVDFVSGYGRSANGNVAVLTGMCLLSQYPFAVPTKDKTAAEACRALLQILNVAQSCREILSDNGPEFTSSSFRDLLSQHGIQHVTTAPYAPQSNGVLERWHRYLNQVVRLCQSVGVLTDWESAVEAALKAYRAMPHTASGESPYFLCFREDPKLSIDSFMPIIRRTNHDESTLDRVRSQMEVAFGLARKNICLARKRRINMEQNVPERPLAVGDLVTMRNRAAPKGHALWKSGYRIIKFCGTRTAMVEHTVTGHRARVALQHLVRTEPLAILLDNSSLDVFPGRSKLYLPASALPDLQWPPPESPVDLGELTYSRLIEAVRDRTQDDSPQTAPSPPSPPVAQTDSPSNTDSPASRSDPVLDDVTSPLPESVPPKHPQTSPPSPPSRLTRSGRVSKTTRSSDYVYAVSWEVLACSDSTVLSLTNFSASPQTKLHVVLPPTMS